MGESIDKRASFSLVRYANCWEDSEILIEALALNKLKTCLSIASAGDNALSLLVNQPKLVVAVDLSLVQFACVDIRKAAFKLLDYEMLLQFLGIRECNENRQTIYKKLLRTQLMATSRDFWDSNAAAIRQGLVYFGKFENYFRLFRTYAISLAHTKKTTQELLNQKTKKEQNKIFDTKWNNWRWRLMFEIACNKFVLGRLGRDKEFFKYVEGRAATNIRKRTDYVLREIPVYNNPYVQFILTGKYNNALPYYLLPENFDVIKNQLDTLELFHGSTDDAMKYYNCKFDAFNLSDIFEYMDMDLCESVGKNLIKHAAPSARFAYWNMLVPRSLATLFPDKLAHLKELSSDLLAKDKAPFYQSFEVDEVKV